jgi:sporulation protein YlmC with PRC-barrel domain
MRGQKLLLALLVAGLHLAKTNPAGGQELDQIAPLSDHNRTQALTSHLKATALLGMTVRSNSGERLGRLQDLIFDMDLRTASFAIIERAGPLGAGGTRIAVPLADLKPSADRNQLTLAATKEQFEAASAAPTGGWLAVAGEDWMKKIDRFYGEPSITNQSRYERQEATGSNEGRESIRNSQQHLTAANGQPEQPRADPELKHQVVTPTDEYTMGKINGVIRQDVGDAAGNIQVTLKNGLVTLQGRVANDAQKKLVESQIKALGIVDQVRNDLSVSNY